MHLGIRTVRIKRPRTNVPSLSQDSQQCGASTPRQEVLWSQSADGLFWEDGDVAQATDSFSAQRRLCQGTFADIYWGQRHGTALAFKRLREVRSCLRDGRRAGPRGDPLSLFTSPGTRRRSQRGCQVLGGRGAGVSQVSLPWGTSGTTPRHSRDLGRRSVCDVLPEHPLVSSGDARGLRVLLVRQRPDVPRPAPGEEVERDKGPEPPTRRGALFPPARFWGPEDCLDREYTLRSLGLESQDSGRGW